MVQDTSEIKGKIMSILKVKGPCLPVHVARGIELSMLFTSAFLSELVSEKKIKISHMKVGNSPVYFIPGQEAMLERFAEHLQSKEKEAFSLLKEKKFLKDKTQEPAIRVALRALRDFAFPFTKNDEIIWRYLTFSEEEFTEKEKPKKQKEELNIFDKDEKPEPKKQEKPKPKRRAKKTTSKDNKFFDEVKVFLNKNSFGLKDILGFAKNEIVLLINEKGTEKILIALNKKRINENDISKASKKASEFNLPYIVLSKGGPLKKLSNLIESLKALDSIKSL